MLDFNVPKRWSLSTTRAQRPELLVLGVVDGNLVLFGFDGVCFGPKNIGTV